MGISSIELYRPLAVPDTPPPDTGSPSTSSSYTYSFRLYEDRSWKYRVPISPPMSNYDASTKPDMSAGKGSEEGQARYEAPQRQQLPSLSSIFGPPSQMRPLRSPHSDRPSPLYSPLDRPRSASTNAPERYSNSYFPNVSTPVTQPRSTYEPRLEQERTSLPSVAPPFRGQVSPRVREFEQQLQTGRRNDAAPMTRWPSQSSSSQPDSRRPEYVFGPREPASSYRSANDRLQIVPYAPLGQRQGHDVAPTPPTASTPATVANAEGTPGKDGLGPKIWNGNQFLPRFVRQAEVPGEGLCYFYDDGTHCKAVIDGEQVNAHWGVTKAGKPRKRLAIACLTCREKKIKCDPEFPRCVQCEKFGRVCKFKNAPRGGHNTSPTLSPGEHDESRQMLSHRQADTRRPRSVSSTSVSPRTTMSHPSPELAGLPPKRVRVSYEHYQPASASNEQPSRLFLPPPMETNRSTTGNTTSATATATATAIATATATAAAAPTTAATTTALSWQQRDLPRIHEDMLCRVWQSDPYVSDPQATSTLIASFFNHVDSTTLRFLPAQLVKDYYCRVDNNKKNHAHAHKSPEDLALLYSVLAFGLHVSGGPKHLASEYAHVARFACERIVPGLQLVQCRIILSLFYLANAHHYDSYEALGAAISAALYLQYNLELDHAAADPVMTSYPLDMDRHTYAESRRRTMFSCFILERINGLSPRRPALLNADDIFLRLPCEERVFEKGVGMIEGTTPLFEVARIPSSLEESVGIMGYLAHVADIWGQASSRIQRETFGGMAAVESDMRTKERLSQLQEALPPKFRFSVFSLTKAREDGIDGSLVTLHSVLLLAATKLSRHFSSSSSAVVVGSSSQAELVGPEETTVSLLGDVVFALSVLHDKLVQVSQHNTTSIPPFSMPPCALYAAVEAFEVLTAGGSMGSIQTAIQEATKAREICDAAATLWTGAKALREQLDSRIRTLVIVRQRGTNAIENNPVPGCEVYYRHAAAPEGVDNLMYRILEPLTRAIPS